MHGAAAHAAHHQLVTVMSAALLGACATAGSGPQGGDRTRIVFTNEADESAMLFAVLASGAEVRMGTIEAGVTDTLRVPAVLIAREHVEFVARLRLRGVIQNSGPVAVSNGQWLAMRLQYDGRMLVVLPAQRPGGLLRR